MKKEISKKFYKLFPLVLFCLLSIASVSQAQNKVIEKEFSIGANDVLSVQHAYGKLTVKKATGNKVKAKVTYNVSGKSDADVQRLIKKIQFQEKNSGGTKMIAALPAISMYRKSTFSTEITFEDGDAVKGISNMEIDFELWVPDGVELVLNNKYEDIEIEARSGKVSVELFEADLLAKGLTGALDLSLKYGTANLGTLKSLKLSLFESTLNLDSATKLTMDSKYSKHFIKQLTNPKIASFEGKFTIDKINGTLELNDKYSTLTIDQLEAGDFMLFETKMNLKKVDQLVANTKYGKFEIGTAGSLQFETSFEDDIEVGTLGDFKSEDSKYGDFDIKTLNGRIQLNQDFESDLSVSSVGSSWKGLDITGKYMDINVRIPSSVKYQLDFDADYGKLKFPKKSFNNLNFNDKGDKLQAKGMMQGASSTSAVVKISGYEINTNLQ
ncbi:MAG: hypothetical protein AB8G15_06170 [Saprospiraceae bacterium]